MGKTSSKRRIDGWLLIDKPAGITSSAVVNKVKWALNAKLQIQMIVKAK